MLEPTARRSEQSRDFGCHQRRDAVDRRSVRDRKCIRGVRACVRRTANGDLPELRRGGLSEVSFDRPRRKTGEPDADVSLAVADIDVDTPDLRYRAHARAVADVGPALDRTRCKNLEVLKRER